MNIGRNETSPGNTITLTTGEELIAASAGLYILQYFTEDSDVKSHASQGVRGLEEEVLVKGNIVFEFDTGQPEEKLLLAGLMWVAREKERLMSEAFCELAAISGLEQTFRILDDISIGDHLEKLEIMAERLAEDPGVMEAYETCFK